MDLALMKMALVSITGLSKDALHIYVGLTALFLAVIILRKPLRSYVPWFLVLGLSVAGELVDLRDDLIRLGYWRWEAGLHDILNTQFWPTVLLLLARYTHVFGNPHGRKG